MDEGRGGTPGRPWTRWRHPPNTPPLRESGGPRRPRTSKNPTEGHEHRRRRPATPATPAGGDADADRPADPPRAPPPAAPTGRGARAPATARVHRRPRVPPRRTTAPPPLPPPPPRARPPAAPNPGHSAPPPGPGRGGARPGRGGGGGTRDRPRPPPPPRGPPGGARLAAPPPPPRPCTTAGGPQSRTLRAAHEARARGRPTRVCPAPRPCVTGAMKKEDGRPRRPTSRGGARPPAATLPPEWALYSNCTPNRPLRVPPRRLHVVHAGWEGGPPPGGGHACDRAAAPWRGWLCRPPGLPRSDGDRTHRGCDQRCSVTGRRGGAWAGPRGTDLKIRAATSGDAPRIDDRETGAGARYGGKQWKAGAAPASRWRRRPVNTRPPPAGTTITGNDGGCLARAGGGHGRSLLPTGAYACAVSGRRAWRRPRGGRRRGGPPAGAGALERRRLPSGGRLSGPRVAAGAADRPARGRRRGPPRLYAGSRTGGRPRTRQARR